MIKMIFFLMTFVLVSWNSFCCAAVFSDEELEKNIINQISRVEELRFIQDEARQRGLRVWLFGDTASTYANYVKSDLLRQKGESKILADYNFDFDILNIFRSTQDLNIVIDGSTKQALFTNGIMENQHTDSLSMGLIEVTETPKTEPSIRDLKSWDGKNGQFFRDLADGKNHFLYSPTYAETAQSKALDNPPILSVMKYLTNVFQFDDKLNDEDLFQIKKIISDFDPAIIPKDGYVRKNFEGMGIKLIQQASDLAKAWEVLDDLGLRQKLIASGNSNDKTSLSWWMNKKPLQAKPLGTGSGKTAKELEIDLIAHETNSLQAYEVMDWSPDGKANVFVSRVSAAGERAQYGEGFYTSIGKTGAAGTGTGMTIRFNLDQAARAGEDFDITPEGSLLVKNGNAIHVRPESIPVINVVEYFKAIAEKRELVNHADNGGMVLFKRKLRSKKALLSKSELESILKMVNSEVSLQIKAPSSQLSPLLVEWFALPNSADYPEILETLIQGNQYSAMDQAIVESALAYPHWTNHPELFEKLIARGNADTSFIIYILSMPFSAEHPEWIEALMKKGASNDGMISRFALSESHWRDNLALRFFSGGSAPTVQNIRDAFDKGKTLQPNINCQSLVKVLFD